MRDRLTWKLFVIVWLIISPTEVVADDEADIHSAYSEFRKAIWDLRNAEPDINSAIGLSDFLTRAIHQAYGSEPFSPSNASLMAGYDAGLIRGLVLCSYMSATPNEIVDLVQKGAPATALAILRSWNAMPWSGFNESFGPITVSGDRAKMEYRWKSGKQAEPGKTVSFTDYIEFQRIDGHWKPDFNSIISMADRNALVIAAGNMPSREIKDRSPGEIGFHMAYIASLLYTVPRCPDALLQRDYSNKDDFLKMIARIGLVVGMPIRDWPDRNAAAWWKQ